MMYCKVCCTRGNFSLRFRAIYPRFHFIVAKKVAKKSKITDKIKLLYVAYLEILILASWSKSGFSHSKDEIPDHTTSCDTQHNNP